MQGIVTDEKGAYVKAAIVRLIIAKDSEDGSGAVAVTYVETNEEGKFVIQDLNPDEKYIIEVLLESANTGIDSKAAEEKQTPEAVELKPEPAEPKPEAEPKPQTLEIKAEPASDEAEEVEETEEADCIIDSPMLNNMIEETVRENISVNQLYSSMDSPLKNKPYLTKINLW